MYERNLCDQVKIGYNVIFRYLLATFQRRERVLEYLAELKGAIMELLFCHKSWTKPAGSDDIYTFELRYLNSSILIQSSSNRLLIPIQYCSLTWYH